MTREISDLTEVEVLIFELEFRISLQQVIIDAFEARGLGQEPLELLAQLQGSLRHARVARELLVQRVAAGDKPDLMEVHHPATIQPMLGEGLLPDTAHDAMASALADS